MVVIGLVGGVASGKSTVAQMFVNCGAVWLDADRAAHEVLRTDQVRDACRERWGAGVLTPEGEVDRAAVARIVFGAGGEPELAWPELAWLEAQTHPRIGAMLRNEVELAKQRGAPAVVLDAAVMEKSGWDQLCDRIVFVDCPEPVRRARATARGWTEEQFRAREAAQESLSTRRAGADLVLDSSGSLDATRRQVEAAWPRLLAAASA